MNHQLISNSIAARALPFQGKTYSGWSSRKAKRMEQESPEERAASVRLARNNRMGVARPLARKRPAKIKARYSANRS